LGYLGRRKQETWYRKGLMKQTSRELRSLGSVDRGPLSESGGRGKGVASYEGGLKIDL